MAAEGAGAVMAYTSKGRSIIAAAEAHSDLNAFAAVVALMEGGLLSSNCTKAALRVIAICKTEQTKALARYDRAVAKAGGGTYGR